MKKAISLILAAALILAMIPSFAFAAEESAESYVYNFKKGLHHTSAGAEAGYITICEDWISEDPNEGEWTCNAYYHFGNGSNAATHNGDYFSFRPKIANSERVPTYSPGIALNASSQFMSALAIKVEVKKDGVYTPALTLATEDSSPMWEVFLTEADTELDKNTLSEYIATIDSSDRLGIIDGYGTGADVKKSFLNRELKAGSYYLILISNGKNENCTFTSEGNNVYRVELLLKSFLLRNINEVQVPESFYYNLTSSALADPSTASNYCDVIDYTDDGIWHCTKLLALGYDALAEEENKFALLADLYSRDGSLAETGIKAHLWSNRYVEVIANSLFEDTDKDGKKAEGYTTNTAWGSSTHFAMKIKVPKAGKYKLYLCNQASDTYGCLSNVFFSDSDTDINTMVRDIDGVYQLKNNFDSAVVHTDGVYIGDVEVSADNTECRIVFSPDYDCFATNKNTIKLSTSRAGFQSLNLSGIKLEQIIEPDAELEAEQDKFDEIEQTKKDEIASAVSSGLSNTATVNILATEVNGDSAFEQTARKVTGTPGAMITVMAEDKEGYDFLYWAKGMGASRKAVSENAEYTFKATHGGTWLTAVYKDKSSTQTSVIFYNGNGEEVGRRLVGNGSEIELPALPTLRGYEASKGWALGNADTLYQQGDKIAASGAQMFFVAQFDDPAEDTITIKVNGAELGKYAYGEKVTVTATEREGGSGQKVFVFWKKDGEIVSFDKSYSFLASDDCELTACYENYKPMTESLRKIIINADGENLMAEFIGVDSAVEKGIIFGGRTFAEATHKISMSQSGNQLSAVADIESDEYIGYAILSDGTVIYDK